MSEIPEDLKKEIIGRRVKSIFFKDFTPIGTVESIFILAGPDDTVVYVKWDDIEGNRAVKNKVTDEELRLLVPLDRWEEYQADLIAEKI